MTSIRLIIGNSSLEKSQAGVLIAVGLFIISTTIRFFALNQTPFANGWDGYYYVMQAHSWLELGHLQSADYSLIYPYFTLISFIVGDYELAFKIGTAILAGAFTLTCFFIISRLSSTIYLGILGASYTIFSPGITFFTSQFPKNLLGLIFLALVAYFILRKKYIWVIISLILATLTHRLAAGLSVILLLITFIRFLPLKYLVSMLVLLFLFSLLPGILHISDLQRFEGELNAMPQYAPISFYSLGITSEKWWWKAELIFIGVLIIIFVFIEVRKLIITKTITTDKLMMLALIVFLAFPFFKMDYGSMGYRFFLLFPFLIPFLIASRLSRIKKGYVLWLSGILIISSLMSYRSYDPRLHDAPNHLYHAISDKLEERYSAERYSLVIAHKSLAEVIIYRTEFDALNWAVPENYDHNNVLRVVYGIPEMIMRKYVEKEMINDVCRVSNSYVILPELYWNNILEKATQDGDKQFLELVNNDNNPLEQRPEYLLKGKEL